MRIFVNKVVVHLTYADDMVLLRAPVCGLRKLIKTCEDYASSHGLKYNVNTWCLRPAVTDHVVYKHTICLMEGSNLVGFL